MLIFGQSIFWFIIVFTIIVFVHEFGHYIIARINKVRVEVFSIGFGPEIISFTDKVGTRWKIGIVPLGGYVKFLGDMNPGSLSSRSKNFSKEEKKLSFHNKTIAQRSLIVFGGPFANLLFGFLIFILLFVVRGQNFTPPIVGKLTAHGVAEKAGMEVGDEIISIDREKINKFEDVIRHLEIYPSKPSLFIISRNDELYEYMITPKLKEILNSIGTKQIIGSLELQPKILPKIGNVQANSPASKAGLRENDIILLIDEEKVNDFSDVVNLIRERPSKITKMLIARQNKQIYVEITPDSLETTDEIIGKIGIAVKRNISHLRVIDAVPEALLSTIDIIKTTFFKQPLINLTLTK